MAPSRRHLLLCTVSAVALVPAAGLAWRAATDGLGANPIEELTHRTGRGALQLLLACLAVTPLRRAPGLGWLAPLRRTLGLAAFGYACLHVGTYVALDWFFDWAALLEDVWKRPYVTAGLAAFACLVPLALTSTRASLRRLGARRWTVLHRFVYPGAALAVLHFLWQAKAGLREPLVYAALLALLLGLRVRWRPAAGLSASRRPEGRA